MGAPLLLRAAARSPITKIPKTGIALQNRQSVRILVERNSSVGLEIREALAESGRGLQPLGSGVVAADAAEEPLLPVHCHSCLRLAEQSRALARRTVTPH